MQELSENIQELLRRDPQIARAMDEVDRTLIRAALQRTPMERLSVATAHIRALRRFKRVPPQGS